MKRRIIAMLAAILVTLSVTGCGSAHVSAGNKPESVVGEFISQMYNVKDYKAIDAGDLEKYPKDGYTEVLSRLATEDAMQKFIGNRAQILYISYCRELHVDAEVTSKDIKKLNTNKDGSVVYDYEGTVKLTFADENRQQDESIKGQITVNKVDDKWTVTAFNDVNFDCIAKYYKGSKL